MSSEGSSETIAFTPTWVVASVSSVIIVISLCAERFLHYLGKFLKRGRQDALFQALQKLKEELMLLGFISLLLTVFQSSISHICITKNATSQMLPCKKEETNFAQGNPEGFFTWNTWKTRRLLSGGGGTNMCLSQGKVPLLSLEALHQLHIFIFVLAVVHVVFSATTMVLGGAKIRQWKHWEKAIQKENSNISSSEQLSHRHPHHEFIRTRAMGYWRKSVVVSWVMSFFKQFHASVTKSDYRALRSGFVTMHCKTHPNFDFHKYMVRALEDDFKKVVGISWYLWLFVVIFLLLDVHGWHAYFWLSFLPLIQTLAILGFLDDGCPSFFSAKSAAVSNSIYSRNHPGFFQPSRLLLVDLPPTVGAKLEHIITRLALEIEEKPTNGQAARVKPSDQRFWFHKPGIVLYLIHFILFQNAFEMAFIFWIWGTYGLKSCIMEGAAYLIPRLVIGLAIQVLCSYSTLPLYAIVTQMGDSYKIAIFNEYVQAQILGWAESVRRRKKPGSFSLFGMFRSKEKKQSTSEVQMRSMGIESRGTSNEAQQDGALQGIVVCASEGPDEHS